MNDILQRGDASPASLRTVSERMETWQPHEILAWSIDAFGDRLTMATAFGPEGCVLLSMLADLPAGRRVRVFNLETGYQFAETLQLRDEIRKLYGIEVEYIRADESVEAMESRFGGPIYGSNPDECCRIRKVAPLSRALEGYDAWITAIRRDQTSLRSQAGIVERDRKYGLVKVNPLANWSRQDVWTYIHVNDVPYNPLHDKGYVSIGCRPCTRAIKPGESERSGRWATLAKTECGIHVAA